MDLVTRGHRELFKGALERELHCSEVRDQGKDRDGAKGATAWGWRLRVS